MADLKTVLGDYGADYERTMARFMGSEDLYLKILAMLPRDGSLQTLEQALQAEDRSAAFDAAHTLKGVAGNLGLAPLERVARAIVEPLCAGAPGEDYAVLVQAVKEEFERAAGLPELLKEVE